MSTQKDQLSMNIAVVGGGLAGEEASNACMLPCEQADMQHLHSSRIVQPGEAPCQ